MAEQTNRVYLAGPISNKPYFNFPAFFAGERELNIRGFQIVFNPARHDIETYGEGKGEYWMEFPTGSYQELREKMGIDIQYREVMKKDLSWICDHATHIAFLPGWQDSKGARTEKALGELLGLKEIYL